jgi:hypothetical protein
MTRQSIRRKLLFHAFAATRVTCAVGVNNLCCAPNLTTAHLVDVDSQAGMLIFFARNGVSRDFPYA